MTNHFTPSDIPWLCRWDFNEFLWDHEKSGGAEVLYNRPRYLETFMLSTKLFDLGFNGPAFTWRGIRKGKWVEERLDRALMNGLWQDLWPNSSVIHGTVMASDHCLIIVKPVLDGPKGRKLFRFEAFWAKEVDCRDLVQKCWTRNLEGGVLRQWVRKIKDCQSGLSS